MHPLLKKLNFKDQEQVGVLAAPATFESVLREWKASTKIDTTVQEGDHHHDFILAFALMAADINKIARQIDGRLGEDPVVWIAYPKKSSKNYRSDITRDHGWQILGDLGFEAVRQVAIDDDWSALRFRQARHIKTMKRESLRAMSREGKKRTK